jgi:hypothetical protein
MPFHLPSPGGKTMNQQPNETREDFYAKILTPIIRQIERNQRVERQKYYRYTEKNPTEKTETRNFQTLSKGADPRYGF